MTEKQTKYINYLKSQKKSFNPLMILCIFFPIFLVIYIIYIMFTNNGVQSRINEYLLVNNIDVSELEETNITT